MERRLNKKTETGIVLLISLVIAVFSTFPYIQNGLSGFLPDLQYHMLRIEGVKDALLHGEYPAKIYAMFFGEYGYGSPMLYPDLFLVFPALLRILGFAPVQVWKIFAFVLVFCASVSTYYSFRYILRERKLAACGTFLLVLSQYYIANLMVRVGMSEYIAFIFLPILLAGIYDLIVLEGKNCWMLGVSLGGMLLSHILMFFLGTIFTFLTCMCLALSKEYRACLKDGGRILRLLLTALVTVSACAYYVFPMIEQMASAHLRYETPWVYIGDNTQPFSVFFRASGTYDNIALVGIGIPILFLLIVFAKDILFAAKEWFPARFFIGGGLLIFLLTTDIFPWSILNHTIFNSIQFTFRLYPYALACLCLGLMFFLKEERIEARKNRAVVLTVVLCMMFAVLQNRTYYGVVEETLTIDETYLKAHSNKVGHGEWLPIGVEEAILQLEAAETVLAEGKELPFLSDGSTKHTFSVEEASAGEYVVPLIYYKGYAAFHTDENAVRTKLEVSCADGQKVLVHNTAGQKGTITVYYGGTVVQKVSGAISVTAVFAVMAYLIYRRKRA